MSTTRTTLPRTTALTATLVTALGLGALAVTSPTLGVGALTGVGVGLSVRGLGRSPWWTALAAAALPLGAGGVLVALLLAGGVEAGLLTAVGTVVGISAVGLVAGPLESGQRKLVLGSAAANLLALGPGAAVTAQVESVGSLKAAFVAFVSLTGGGTSGLVVWVLVTGAGVVLAALVVPPAVRANLRGQPMEFGGGPRLPVGVVVVTLVLVFVSWFGSVFPLVGPAVESLVASGVPHGVLAGVVLLLACLTVLALFAGGVWVLNMGAPVMPLATGALVGAAAVVVISALVTAETGRPSAAVYGPITAGLAGSGLLAGWTAEGFSFSDLAPSTGVGRTTTQSRWRARDRHRIGTPSAGVTLSLWESTSLTESLGPSRAGRLVSIGLTGGAVLVALGMEPTPSLGQAGVLVAIASGLYVHALVTRGWAAARDVGPGNVSRVSQFIWVSWTAGLTVFGLVVATVGLLLASTFPVPLSVPAAAGVALALVALAAGIRLLSRSRSV